VVSPNGCSKLLAIARACLISTHYALAKATGQPLLFKGDDFAVTDIVAAAS
jgi:hypothetical protein